MSLLHVLFACWNKYTTTTTVIFYLVSIIRLLRTAVTKAVGYLNQEHIIIHHC